MDEKRHKGTIVAVRTANSLLAVFISTIIIILSVVFLRNIAIEEVSLQSLADYFIPDYFALVWPKTKEQFIFLTVLLSLPVVTLLSIKLVDFFQAIIKKHYQLVLWLLIGFLVSVLFLANTSTRYFELFCFHLIYSYAVKFLIIIIATPCLIKLILEEYKLKSGKHIWLLNYFCFIVISLAIIYQSLSFRVVAVSSVNYTFAWLSHFNAVFYSMTQAFVGKKLLIDLPAEYGLYATFLTPIFKLIGLSVFTFTLVMALLQIICFFCLYIIANKLIKSRVILLLLMASYFITTAYTFILANKIAWEPYFQYSPLRMICPTIALLFVMWLAKSVTRLKIILTGFFCGFSLLWNLDSGVPVTGGFLAYLGCYILFARQGIDRRKSCTLIVIAIAAIAAMLGLYFSYLYYGLEAKHINWVDIYKYQHLYYIAGFAMLPIANYLTDWQIIYGIYLTGLIVAFSAFWQNFQSRVWDMVFFLSIMGFGLFIYFEGRTNLTNLILVSWPAYLLVFIFADRLLRITRFSRQAAIFYTLSFPIISLGLLLTFETIYVVPILNKTMFKNWDNIFYPKPTEITENIAFIKKHIQQARRIIIISPFQSTYFGELGVESAIDGPGLSEIILIKDFNIYIQQLKTKHYKYIFLQLNTYRDKKSKLVTKVHSGRLFTDPYSFGSKAIIEKIIATGIFKSCKLLDKSKSEMMYYNCEAT